MPSSTAAAVGPSRCTSGSHVCTGHIGTFTEKAAKKHRKISTCGTKSICSERHCAMSKLCDCEYRYSMAASIASEPVSENRKKRSAACARFDWPQVPISRYSGISVASKNTKNSMPSCAVNTPCIKPDNSRNAPKYWATRFVMDCHDAMTTITVVMAVSTVNHNEIPSTPTCHATPNDGSHGLFSTNCIAATLLRKTSTNGTAGSRATHAPISAIQRVRLSARSEPARSTTTPATIGIQISRLSNGGNCMRLTGTLSTATARLSQPKEN